ncbi:MAG: hypothetical protein KF773_34020 [Deltaproteobacteria bacterium]|nr:hypothetical protein [Deltaproteobacteria bacterium]MCW5801238.1 hypothetical protein [Deltaproteobacteria bacterium]
MKRIAVALVALFAPACVEERPPLEGTQSLRVELVAPANPGAPDARLSPADRQLTVNVTALDANGDVDTGYTNTAQVYAQFLGTLTPSLGTPPLATIQLTAGVAMNQTVTLPPVFGPTTVWIDDGASASPTFATGTSPTLWYPDPHIQDLQRPVNEMALNALSSSPLEDKQVSVRSSRHGANGRLVVTSVFAQGYTASDVLCQAGGAPPCTAEAYDHIMVFSFSAPRDNFGRLVHEGQLITGFAGGQSEFNGLTEIGFPQTFADDNAEVNPARMPEPVVLDPATWFKGLSDPNGMINFERNEAAPIAVLNGAVCDLDNDYATYKQWKLDPNGTGGNCAGNRNVINVITAGISAIDPPSIVGSKPRRVVGVLRPVNIGSFNVWIIYPRSAADVQM